MCTLVCEGIEFLQQQRVNIIFLSQKSFPYRSLHERIYWNPFLVRVLLISTKHEAQDVSLYMQMWRPSKATLGSSTSPTSFSLIGVNYPSSLPKALQSAMRCIRGLPNTITCQWIPTGLFGASFYTFAHCFQNRTGPGGRTVKTGNRDENRFFKLKEPDFLLIP